VAGLQHPQQFKLPPPIGPCLHTIGLNDLIVSPLGIRGPAGLSGIFSVPEATSGEVASSESAMFDKNVFFQRQIEECRELLRHAATDADRAFWLQVAERWEGLFKQIKETVPRKKSENAAKAPL
jgi:hypothetical protein